jgi:hypothetical protein
MEDKQFADHPPMRPDNVRKGDKFEAAFGTLCRHLT